jgi:hypothetical protein
VAIRYDGLSAVITAIVVMKINNGSIQRVDAVKCCVFLQLLSLQYVTKFAIGA